MNSIVTSWHLYELHKQNIYFINLFLIQGRSYKWWTGVGRSKSEPFLYLKYERGIKEPTSSSC